MRISGVKGASDARQNTHPWEILGEFGASSTYLRAQISGTTKPSERRTNCLFAVWLLQPSGNGRRALHPCQRPRSAHGTLRRSLYRTMDVFSHGDGYATLTARLTIATVGSAGLQRRSAPVDVHGRLTRDVVANWRTSRALLWALLTTQAASSRTVATCSYSS